MSKGREVSVLRSASDAAQERGDDLAGTLPVCGGELLEALGVLVLDADNDRELRPGVAGVGLDVAWVDRRFRVP